MNKPDISLIFPSSAFLLNSSVHPPLGILYLSAYLKQNGVSVQCLDLGLSSHDRDMADSDTIGITITSPQRNEAFELANYYSEQGKTIIAGGPHATHMREECLDAGFKFVVPGYGENRLMNIMDPEQYSGSMPGIDNLPMPDRDALPIHKYQYFIDDRPATVIMTSRGCCYDCSFCGRINCSFQQRSAGETIKEFLTIQNRYGFNAIMIFDDIFIANKKRLTVISDAMKDRDIKFRCFARSNLVTPETCRLMKAMGMVEVGIGIESGSDEVLAKNMKGTTRAMNTRAVHLLHEHGLRAKAFLIVGLPGETDETVAETESWIREAQPDDIDASLFQPLPGSPIFKDPKRFGIEFEYGGQSTFYKGTPGTYMASARTEALSRDAIVDHRDRLERKYKDKENLR